jgi:hypothetical protein
MGQIDPGVVVRHVVAFLPHSLSPLNDDALADFVLSCIVREVAPCPKPGS